ncbi:response regulator [Bacillus salitolerans]|uniref:Response regulator n=1 Tax=Bacillus salitolerans TaxID=1437434 RepID=A0ABW4LJR1_9BACI
MQKTILIVDDEPVTRQGLKKTLESWALSKYKIVSTDHANSALEVLNNEKVHLIITDICMPGTTGLEMLKLLKEKHQFPVVIIISAHSDFNYAKEAIEIGVVNYLLKPIDKQKLIIEVEKALEIEQKRERVDMIERVVDDQLVNIKMEDQIDSQVKRAIKFVEDNMSNHEKLCLTEVAKQVHLNASYFSVLFKEHTNMTFSEYVTRCRIQKAKNLLLTSCLSISEIAELVGYRTPKYFNKIFKEYEGLTPSQYKKK